MDSFTDEETDDESDEEAVDEADGGTGGEAAAASSGWASFERSTPGRIEKERFVDEAT